MKEVIFKIFKILGIILLIIWIGYNIIYIEIKTRKNEIIFCKEQCNYDIENKKWFINLDWIFEEEGLESELETRREFSEKNLDECVEYCKTLGNHLKYLSDPGSYQRER